MLAANIAGQPARTMFQALARQMRRHPTLAFGFTILLVMALAGIFAPWLGTKDPLATAPMLRLRGPSPDNWLGTDMLGRDLYSRVLYGARISLLVGLGVASLAVTIGTAIGLMAGFVKWFDAIVMRVMDGLMSIPSILLAIALMALTQASVGNVIFALTVAEMPRVVRLVRSLVLGLKEQTFVEAATASGTRLHVTLIKHILPNIAGPLLVQGTYVFAAAMISESILSFIGAGTPVSVPSWGNIMSEGRTVFQLAYHIVLFPGVLLALTVLSVNLVGDGLRDALDPRLSRRQ